jgi:hypothetical protein
MPRHRNVTYPLLIQHQGGLEPEAGGPNDRLNRFDRPCMCGHVFKCQQHLVIERLEKGAQLAVPMLNHQNKGSIPQRWAVQDAS